MQVDVVLERELKIPHLDLQAAETVSHWARLELLKPESLPQVTRFLHQSHTSNNAAPCAPMEAVFILTTTPLTPSDSILLWRQPYL